MQRIEEERPVQSLVRKWWMAIKAVVDLVRGQSPGQSEIEHPDVRFEQSDLSTRTVIITGFSILGVTWICALILLVYYRYEITRVSEAHVAPSATGVPTGALPPEPRLQISPRSDFQRELAYETKELQSYSWLDRSKGTVTIPIDRAMELIAQRGIPPQFAPADLKLYPPHAGTRDTGFENKVLLEPR